MYDNEKNIDWNFKENNRDFSGTIHLFPYDNSKTVQHVFDYILAYYRWYENDLYFVYV